VMYRMICLKPPLDQLMQRDCNGRE
jgi:hypothetical protein